MPAAAPHPPAAAPGAARRAMAPGAVVFTLTLLLGIQPVATDLYLPALPGIGARSASASARRR